MRLILSVLFVLSAVSSQTVMAQDQVKTTESMEKGYGAGSAEVRRMWDAVRKASPDFAQLFCTGRSGVCIPDWPSFRSPVGGWRLIDPQTCDADPRPCSLGPRLAMRDQNFAVWPPPGPMPGWAPCDVFPKPGDNSTLQCDDTCGCTILQLNCAGTWSCNSNECSCGP